MSNDSRSVGRSANNPARMEPRSVPVEHDKPRINDQRKVRPHSVGEPAMGNRPTGGAQKEPKKPPLGKDRMEMRDVPVERMTEAELNEWNPFNRYTKAPLPQHTPGDMLAWHHDKSGIYVIHIRDGQIVGQPNLVMSRDLLKQQMQAEMQKYWQAKNDMHDIRWNPRQAGLAAVKRYAQENGIQPVKMGEYGREIPQVMMGGRGAAPASAPPVAAPGGPGAAGGSNPASAFSRGAPPSGPPGGSAPNRMGRNVPNWANGGGGPKPAPRPNPAAAKPMVPPRNAGPTDGPGGMPRSSGAASGSMNGGMGGDYQQNMNGGSSMNGGPAVAEKPRVRIKQNRQVGTDQQDQILKALGYNPMQLMQMSRDEKQSAIAKGKMRGTAREAYPDTSYETDEPSHESRIGDLAWNGSRGRMSNPKTPRSNKEFMEPRELRIEKIHEFADHEMDQFIRGTAARLGFKNIVFEEESAGHPDYHQIKSGTGVTIRSPQGQDHRGRAVMRGPHGWVLNMGGRHGTPDVATPHNTVKVHASKKPRTEAALPRLRLRWVGEAGHLPSPTHALPGNLPGTGKDFRPIPGHNKSKKQPGNLVGSNKVNKVKPGFVG